MEIPVQSLAVQRTWKEVQKQGLEANGVLLFKGARRNQISRADASLPDLKSVSQIKCAPTDPFFSSVQRYSLRLQELCSSSPSRMSLMSTTLPR